MIAYADWIGRAVKFHERLRKLPGEVNVDVRVDPPMDTDAAEKLSRTLRIALPSPIRGFVTMGSASCSCSYYWEPPDSPNIRSVLEDVFWPSLSSIGGGVSLCQVSDCEVALESCRGVAESFNLAPRERDLWLNTFPFVSLLSGSYVGLYVGKHRTSADLPVTYLDLEGCSTGAILAANFDRFLTDSEDFLYLAPELLSPIREIPSAQRELKRQALHKLFSECLA